MDATPRLGDEWMDELTDSAGTVHHITEESWLDLVFGVPDDIRKNRDVAPNPQPIGALRLWNAQRRAKIRPAAALETAACQELSGFDALRDRNPWAAEARFNAAANTITRAAEAKAKRRGAA